MSSELVIKRRLNIQLPAKQSAFLWGARKTGKTTFLVQKFPQSVRYDLLETDLFFRLFKEPHLLREELIGKENRKELIQPVIIDEIQKIPQLLDEVHWLIENRKISFILCGSSPRKLKREGVNLLGGRAWRFTLFPFTTEELGNDFDLLRAINRGLMPSHYLDENYERTIKAYINDYLKEEIRAEGLTRNIPAFARFLDSVAFSDGELVNYSNISRECGVDSKTVAEYYQILVDTLLGTFIESFRKRAKRQIITSTPKFYLFDVGVAGGLTKRKFQINRGIEFGHAFEHLVLMELIAHRSYTEKDYTVNFWRTKDGHEVDFVIDNGRVAIEVKGSSHIDRNDTKGLALFIKEHSPERAIIVCQDTRQRTLSNGIEIMPWQIFFNMLWNDEI